MMSLVRKSVWLLPVAVLGVVLALPEQAGGILGDAVAQTARKVAPPPPSPDDGSKLSMPIATFSGLDKITGRITSFDVAINETVQFGALQVTPRVCYARPQTIAPLTTAFAEVDEITLDNKIRRIFTGWMFADSPGLHAVEHAVYDIWLTECKASSKDVPGFAAAPVPVAPVPSAGPATPAAVVPTSPKP